jgi:hypothetical protein
MTQPDMTEINAYHERIHRPIIQVPTSPVGRFFFGIALVLWFGILLLPCAMFSLAVNGSIRIPHISAPEPATQPFLEVNLIMSVEQRGLQIVRSVILPAQNEQQCVETHVSYLLWYTDGTDESAVFCDCYKRDSTSARWQSIGSTLGVCQG